jgi:hypothetical protein
MGDVSVAGTGWNPTTPESILAKDYPSFATFTPYAQEILKKSVGYDTMTSTGYEGFYKFLTFAELIGKSEQGDTAAALKILNACLARKHDLMSDREDACKYIAEKGNAFTSKVIDTELKKNNKGAIIANYFENSSAHQNALKNNDPEAKGVEIVQYAMKNKMTNEQIDTLKKLTKEGSISATALYALVLAGQGKKDTLDKYKEEAYGYNNIVLKYDTIFNPWAVRLSAVFARLGLEALAVGIGQQTLNNAALLSKTPQGRLAKSECDRRGKTEGAGYVAICYAEAVTSLKK